MMVQQRSSSNDDLEMVGKGGKEGLGKETREEQGGMVETYLYYTDSNTIVQSLQDVHRDQEVQN